MHSFSAVEATSEKETSKERTAVFVKISSDRLVSEWDKRDVWDTQKRVRGKFLLPFFSNCLGYVLAPIYFVRAVTCYFVALVGLRGQ